MIGNLRNVEAYTLTTLPPNGIVTATAWNGLQDWITSLHQRGATVTTRNGHRKHAEYSPIIGFPTAFTPKIGDEKTITIPFQIPSGYNRFALLVTLALDDTGWGTTTIGGWFPALATMGAYFSSGGGPHVINTWSSGGTLGNRTEFYDGELPIRASVGHSTQAALCLSYKITLPNGGSLSGNYANCITGYSGFYSICLAIYKDDQC